MKLIFIFCLLFSFQQSYAGDPFIQPHFGHSFYSFDYLPVPSTSYFQRGSLEAAMDYIVRFSPTIERVTDDVRAQGVMRLDLECYFPNSDSRSFHRFYYKNKADRLDAYHQWFAKLVRTNPGTIIKGNTKTIYKDDLFEPYCLAEFYGVDKAMRRAERTEMMRLYD